jgi:glycosyltransferase involved in cell wall biosynthesis
MHVLMLTPDAQMIDRRILQEARTLVGAGHRVTLLAGFECREPKSYVQDGIEIHRLTYDWDDERLKRIRSKLPAHDGIRRVANRAFMLVAKRLFTLNPFCQFVFEHALKYRPDVIHVHDFPMLKIGVLAAEQLDVPLVYDAHEIYYAQDVLPAKVQRQYRREEHKYIGRARHVITVNDFIADIMAERYAIPKPHVLHNAADELTPAVRDGRSKLRERIPHDGPMLLYQGWMSPERNIEAIVKAMPHVDPAAKLAMVGYGAQEPVLKQIAHDLNVTDRVHFLGQIDSGELAAYTRGASLGLIPYLPIDENHHFCSPNKFFEFVVGGVPILAHDLPFFRMMGKRHGVVDVTNFAEPTAVAASINGLLKSGKLATMQSACREAGQVLNWRVEGGKLLKIYESIAPTLNRRRAA